MAIHPRYAQQVFDYKISSWVEFSKWWIWTHPPSPETRTVKDDELFCKQKHEQYLKGENILILAFDIDNEDHVIGGGGLGRCQWDIPMFSLGFSVRTSEIGKGYATEIAQSLTKFAFDALGAQKVSASHAEGHAASQRVIEKTGFKKEGILRAQHRLEHGLVDEHHYGLINGDALPQIDITWGD